MKINEIFIRDYLTAGQTADNFIFENCPTKFLQEAEQLLKISANGVKSCVISIDTQAESSLNKVLEQCENSFQQKLLARDYVTALVIAQVLKTVPQEKESLIKNQQNIENLVSGDFNKAKSCHAECFMPHQVAKLAKQYGNIELNFFLQDISNVYLQQAVNLFVSSREPYSVKIFTNKATLCTYYDPMGNIIECPHDFMRRDVNKFIDIKTDLEKEQ